MGLFLIDVNHTHFVVDWLMSSVTSWLTATFVSLLGLPDSFILDVDLCSKEAVSLFPAAQSRNSLCNIAILFGQ